jgi:hypothetical protein
MVRRVRRQEAAAAAAPAVSHQPHACAQPGVRPAVARRREHRELSAVPQDGRHVVCQGSRRNVVHNTRTTCATPSSARARSWARWRVWTTRIALPARHRLSAGAVRAQRGQSLGRHRVRAAHLRGRGRRGRSRHHDGEPGAPARVCRQAVVRHQPAGTSTESTINED